MIESAFLKKSDLLQVLPSFIEDHFGFSPKETLEQIEPVFAKFVDEIQFYIEYPYVEKFYRDTYYTFFSKKHNSCNRNSIRISLFNSSLDTDKYFFDIDDTKEIEDTFWGFITLRPTTYRLFGHTFISPKALKNHDFVCCLSKKTVSVNGRKLSVSGFPYCSQDNESITCSEAAIINLFDYFSNKYPEYSSILPSHVIKILSKQSFQRQLPTHGLPTENISYVLKKLGFGSVVYSCSRHNEEFNIYKQADFKELFYIYIESGIPFIATLTSKTGYHAVLVIGRENVNKELSYNQSFLGISFKKNYLFSEGFDKILIMNDNHPPYEIVNFTEPLIDTDDGSVYHFTSFIIPLHSKVHVDAYQFKKSFSLIIENFAAHDETKHIIFVPQDKKCIYRYFLTSSKSYKNYIALSKDVSNDFKAITICKSMPKFIWVGEIIQGDTLKEKQNVESIIVTDATESGLSGHLIFATNSNFLIMRNSTFFQQSVESAEAESEVDRSPKENVYKIFKFDKEVFYTFATNLKGEHTSWQN